MPRVRSSCIVSPALPDCHLTASASIMTSDLPFQPSMLGFVFEFHDAKCKAVITDEIEDAFYIESSFYTGWMKKHEFWENWGIEE